MRRRESNLSLMAPFEAFLPGLLGQAGRQAGRGPSALKEGPAQLPVGHCACGCSKKPFSLSLKSYEIVFSPLKQFIWCSNAAVRGLCFILLHRGTSDSRV